MNLSITKILFLFFLSIVCTNCGNKIDKKVGIIAKWKVIKVGLESQKSKTDTLLPDPNEREKDYKITFDIRKNGSYLIQKGLHADSGKWSMSTDDRVIIFISDINTKDNATFILENISKYDMILSVQENGKKETLTFNIDDK